ncbi:MAG: FtsQ-type POTRA domain-containing protein [Oscillochloridaceae bacterium]|nr:FtsQ-type POTRA domain-containing protein [Chloroflexaceae bacterium]MDW8391100.1 FtsQ-type POTRA domain-containing protein [Oscillochloridaceae bacterium]
MEYNTPNTRERIAARRQQRRAAPPPPTPRRLPAALVSGQQAVPGARRLLTSWLANGRLLSLAICIVAVGIMAYALTSPRFSVRQIRVEGNRILEAELVADLADAFGRPIWFVKPAAVAARLHENAYIASASVDLALPDVMRIRIVERRPEVRWQAGGMHYLVDGTGKVLGLARESAADDVLVIADHSHLELKPNDLVDVDAVHLAQELALRLPVELGFTPVQIGWDYGLGVFVRGPLGQTIVFGRSENLDRKLAILNVLLQDQTAFTYLDLRPSNPFYQNRAPATPAPVSTPAP